jgi:transposase InsO family protein
MRHLIHCRDTTTAEQLAELFLEHIFRLHGLPRTIVSDRGTQFVAEFWKALCKCVDTQARLSTPCHPQTDEQTERFNAVIEQYLRCFINYLQDDWNSWLPLSEFTANNQASESRCVSPFFANYGYDPKWQFDLRQSNRSPLIPAETDAHETARQLKKILENLQAEILRAQYRYREGADQRRTPAPAVTNGSTE